jgi:uncharacterized protein (UPF0548 family)
VELEKEKTGALLFSLQPWSDDEVRDFIPKQSGTSFAFPHVGATASSPPRRYNVDHARIQLGRGSGVWDWAVEAVRAWQMFNIPWLWLCWPSAPIRAGTDVAVLAHQFGFWSLNACRFVYVVEDEGPNRRRYGFAYGTLDEHADRGEERFTVEWNREDDAVWYDILAFSRPKKLLAIIGYPLARSLQRRFALPRRPRCSPVPVPCWKPQGRAP